MDQVGQLFITGISGKVLTQEERDFIREQNIGGVILFSHNYESPAQLADLANDVQTLRDEYPLFVSVDHEGGRVHRFKTQFTHFPSTLELAGLDSPKTIYDVHKAMAEELRAVGVNLSYSPCCDVLVDSSSSVIGDRSFGKDPDTVCKFLSGAIRGLQTNSVIACAKHFPGHGATIKDSHDELPRVTISIEELAKTHFPPFQKAAKSRVQMIMMAHMIVDCIDSDLPATLSKHFYSIIRDELKYNRIILTDDLEMGAIVKHYSIEEASVMALAAGSDLLLYRTFEGTRKGYEATRSALKTKKLMNSDINEKVKRVMKAKKEYLSEYSPIYIPDIENKISTPAIKSFCEQLKQKLKN